MKRLIFLTSMALVALSCSMTKGTAVEDDIYYVPGQSSLLETEAKDAGYARPAGIYRDTPRTTGGTSTPPASFNRKKKQYINAATGEITTLDMEDISREAQEKLSTHDEISENLYNNSGYWLGGFKGNESDLPEIQRIINLYPNGFAFFSNNAFDIALNLSFDSDWNVYTYNGRYWWFPSSSNFDLYSELFMGTYPDYIWTVIWDDPRFNWNFSFGFGSPFYSRWHYGWRHHWHNSWYDPWYGGWYDPWTDPWFHGWHDGWHRPWYDYPHCHHPGHNRPGNIKPQPQRPGTAIQHRPGARPGVGNHIIGTGNSIRPAHSARTQHSAGSGRVIRPGYMTRPQEQTRPGQTQRPSGLTRPAKGTKTENTTRPAVRPRPDNRNSRIRPGYRTRPAVQESKSKEYRKPQTNYRPTYNTGGNRNSQLDNLRRSGGTRTVPIRNNGGIRRR